MSDGAAQMPPEAAYGNRWRDDNRNGIPDADEQTQQRVRLPKAGVIGGIAAALGLTGGMAACMVCVLVAPAAAGLAFLVPVIGGFVIGGSAFIHSAWSANPHSSAHKRKIRQGINDQQQQQREAVEAQRKQIELEGKQKAEALKQGTARWDPPSSGAINPRNVQALKAAIETAVSDADVAGILTRLPALSFLPAQGVRETQGWALQGLRARMTNPDPAHRLADGYLATVDKFIAAWTKSPPSGLRPSSETAVGPPPSSLPPPTSGPTRGPRRSSPSGPSVAPPGVPSRPSPGARTTGTRVVAGRSRAPSPASTPVARTTSRPTGVDH